MTSNLSNLSNRPDTAAGKGAQIGGGDSAHAHRGAGSAVEPSYLFAAPIPPPPAPPVPS